MPFYPGRINSEIWNIFFTCQKVCGPNQLYTYQRQQVSLRHWEGRIKVLPSKAMCRCYEISQFIKGVKQYTSRCKNCKSVHKCKQIGPSRIWKVYTPGGEISQRWPGREAGGEVPWQYSQSSTTVTTTIYTRILPDKNSHSKSRAMGAIRHVCCLCLCYRCAKEVQHIVQRNCCSVICVVPHSVVLE